jgi:hypothetical protein
MSYVAHLLSEPQIQKFILHSVCSLHHNVTLLFLLLSSPFHSLPLSSFLSILFI